MPNPWHALGHFRATPRQSPRPLALRDHQGDIHQIEIEPGNAAESQAPAEWTGTHITAAGTRTLDAPFPASIAELKAQPGDKVTAGDAIAVIEAMKMFHTLAAPATLEVAEVRVSEGDQVKTGQVLVVFHSPSADISENADQHTAP